MFKKLGLVAVVLVAVCLMAGVVMAAEEATKAAAPAATPVVAPAMTEATPAPAAPVVVGNKVCPVSGSKIADADLGKNTVEYKGMVYNLCSPGCKDVFLKDPDTYIAKVNEELSKTKEAAAVAVAPVVPAAPVVKGEKK